MAYAVRISYWSSDVCSSDLADAVRRSSGQELAAKQVEDLLEGIAGGMPRLVHEVLRQDRVSNRGDAVRVAARGIDLDGYEAIAERFAQVLEPLARHELVAGEADRKSTRLNSSH